VIIKVLGPGCNNCKTLERVTREAIAELGIAATIEKVEDYAIIGGYGVMSTPALVIDEKFSLPLPQTNDTTIWPVQTPN
jgi:small redox-active disulfide protein 2